MLLKNYTKKIFRSECNPSEQSLHCFAYLEEDVGAALPYLNAVLGGVSYAKDPPSVTVKSQGKLITVHAKKIAINILEDEQEADKILEWLKQEINSAWENRAKIEPRYESAQQPKLFEILKYLPKTNCRECGEPTCMVFGTRMAEGIKGAEDCTQLDEDNRKKLQEYMSRFALMLSQK